MSEVFAEHGVRGYHFRVLAALEQHGPCSQADVGRATGIDRSDVVATLDELVTWGLARREPDRFDRRRNVVTVTRVGLVRLEELDDALSVVQRAVLEPLTPPERATVVQLLGKLV